MSLSLLALLFLALLAAGYFGYGRWISRFFQLDPQAITPAEALQDGQDFLPTKPFYLFGQHFSAIAAAGPIAGPILACQQFGWLPCLLWIGFGVILIGAVHDFSALVASVRHRGDSIAEIIRENIGKKAYLAIMAFIWLALLYVIIAFTDITAQTFVGQGEELSGQATSFNRGGAVAMASLLYLVLSIAMGCVERYLKPPLWLLTLIFVPATLGVVYLGTQLSGILLFSQQHWSLILLVYCAIASLIPLWLLLQPRGYLGGFILYMALAIGSMGIFFGGYDIMQPAFKGWSAPAGSLFPFLFVTIACGACSGFHGLVCSGTTSKQIAKEQHCRSVGYGAMLMEALVAVIALGTVMILPSGEKIGPPGAVYAQGIGKFLSLVIGPEREAFAVTFGAMAFSTFVFDTLDVTTRLGRYILQELTGRKSWASAVLATLLTVGIPAIFLLLAPAGSWLNFWTLFGSSNQMLAALTLLGISVWLKRKGKSVWFVALPMLFVMGVTFSALIAQCVSLLRAYAQTGILSLVAVLNGGVALLLMALAIFIIGQAWGSAKNIAR